MFALTGTIRFVSDIAKITTATMRASNCRCLHLSLLSDFLQHACGNRTCERRGDF